MVHARAYKTGAEPHIAMFKLGAKKLFALYLLVRLTLATGVILKSLKKLSKIRMDWWGHLI